MVGPGAVCGIGRGTKVGRAVRGEDLGGGCERDEQEGEFVSGLHVEGMVKCKKLNRKGENGGRQSQRLAVCLG